MLVLLFELDIILQYQVMLFACFTDLLLIFYFGCLEISVKGVFFVGCTILSISSSTVT